MPGDRWVAIRRRQMSAMETMLEETHREEKTYEKWEKSVEEYCGDGERTLSAVAAKRS
jgi:hypothetical protein